jgi:hypothetical protein
MTEYITKDQLIALADASSEGSGKFDWQHLVEQINLAFEQRLEVVGYVQDGYADKIKLYGDTLVTKSQSTLRQTPLYALKGDSK